MRTKQQMTDLIMSRAAQDPRIRAVYMNGSRANPMAEEDLFQDFDIVYAVEDVREFVGNMEWLQGFGEFLVLQDPQEMGGHYGSADGGRYAYLMLFSDGNRIDLTFMNTDLAVREVLADSQSVLLLDKDGILPELPPTSDRDYHTRRPSERFYHGVCNEFWWCVQNVAKGLARGELPYAKAMQEQIIRPMLDYMVSWQIAIPRDFKVSPGKMGRYFPKLLSEEDWSSYQNTYSGPDPEDCWQSVFEMCRLFSRLAAAVAGELGFDYHMQEENGMMKYINAVYNLPDGAEGIL